MFMSNNELDEPTYDFKIQRKLDGLPNLGRAENAGACFFLGSCFSLFFGETQQQRSDIKLRRF